MNRYACLQRTPCACSEPSSNRDHRAAHALQSTQAWPVRHLMMAGVIALLAACGGGGGGSSTTTSSSTTTTTSTTTTSTTPTTTTSGTTPTTSSPTSSTTSSGSNTSTGSTSILVQAGVGTTLDLVALENTQLERLNHMRALAGVGALAKDAQMVTASRGHTNYLVVTGETGHTQAQSSLSAFTGVDGGARLQAAGYQANNWGEGIARGPALPSQQTVDDLLAAPFHRLVLLRHEFSDAGFGVQQYDLGATVSTVKLASKTSAPVRDVAQAVLFPAAGQTGVPQGFYSNLETPDPYPGKNLVGYPITFQIDVRQTLSVSQFTVTRVRDNAVLDARLITQSVAAETPASAAILVPANLLDPSTTYRVQFSGSGGGVSINRSWEFTTAAASTPSLMVGSQSLKAGGETTLVTLQGVLTGVTPVACLDQSTMMSVRFTSSRTMALTTSDGCQSRCTVTLKVNPDGGPCDAAGIPSAAFTITR